MPRMPRCNQLAESLTYHIYNRGNGKLDIFHDDDDFKRFLDIIKMYKQKYIIDIFHWVLLNNHFHFVLTIDTPALLSKCIGGMLQSYAQYHHSKWNSAGRLWQGRFASQPIQKEKYLFECGRYIERNPMRAGIVRYPWDYKWSSCQMYITGHKDNTTTPDPAFDAFGDSGIEGVRQYKEWLMEGELADFNKMSAPVGDKTFIAQLLLKNGRLIRKKRRQSKNRKI